MNWKEELQGTKGYRDLLATKFGKSRTHNLELFIQNHVIKKLIDDIPVIIRPAGSQFDSAVLNEAKQQLRDKWL